MRPALRHALLAVSAGFFCAGATAQSGSATGSQAVPGTPAASLFARPVSLRGTLGDAQIQMHLRPKAEFEDGVEGDYFVFGNSQKILLAGEQEGGEIFLEESENGTDVSGQWEGKLSGGALSGNWSSADGSVTKPFTLKPVRADDRTKQTSPGSARRSVRPTGALTP